MRRRRADGFVIPVTVDDLAANGLLGEADPQVCWERSVETLTAQEGRHRRTRRRLRRANRGLPSLCGATERTAEIVSLRSFVEDGGARLKQLLSRLGAAGTVPVPEGPPGGDLEGVAGDARFPPRRRASTLRSEGAVGLACHHLTRSSFVTVELLVSPLPARQAPGQSAHGSCARAAHPSPCRWS